jgi:hypothetical protein
MDNLIQFCKCETIQDDRLTRETAHNVKSADLGMTLLASLHGQALKPTTVAAANALKEHLGL